MAPPSTPRPGTREPREQRAERILDVTADLVLRWGYRKTTLDDIAREADVAKGTLFLHWRNREALFVSLLRRERLRLYEDLIEQLSEAGTVTLQDFFTRFAAQAFGQPLVRAMFVGDEDTLGRMVRQKDSGGTTAAVREEFLAYVTELRELGLTRTDLSETDIQTVYTATLMGFVSTLLGTPPLSAIGAEPPDHQRCAELCGDALARLLRPTGADGSDDSGNRPRSPNEAFTRATLGFLQRASAAVRARYQDSLDEVRSPG